MTVEACKMTGDVPILIVDDDQVCVMAIRRALRKLDLKNPVRVACDGVEALEILRGGEGRDRMTAPFVVLLDINMPRMNGHEFLAEIRRDPVLRPLPVFVLSTSDSPYDVRRAYSQNVAGYLVKTDLSGSLSAALRMIDSFTRAIVFPVL